MFLCIYWLLCVVTGKCVCRLPDRSLVKFSQLKAMAAVQHEGNDKRRRRSDAQQEMPSAHVREWITREARSMAEETGVQLDVAQVKNKFNFCSFTSLTVQFVDVNSNHFIFLIGSVQCTR